MVRSRSSALERAAVALRSSLQGAPADQRADDAFAALVGDRGLDVVARAEAIEQAQLLEAARNAGARHLVRRQAVDARVAKIDVARVGREIAGDQIERRGLAGAVAADQAGDRAGLHVERQVAHGLQAAERFRQRFEPEKGVAVVIAARYFSTSRYSPIRPCRR